MHGYTQPALSQYTHTNCYRPHVATHAYPMRYRKSERGWYANVALFVQACRLMKVPVANASCCWIKLLRISNTPKQQRLVLPTSSILAIKFSAMFNMLSKDHVTRSKVIDTQALQAPACHKQHCNTPVVNTNMHFHARCQVQRIHTSQCIAC